MNRRIIAVFALFAALLTVAAPVHADDGALSQAGTCVTVWTDPPDAKVDPNCIWDIIEDLPPVPP